MFITEAILCLALNVYHEAKNQPFIGQVAVAQVVMNRVYDERYPNTVCEVVEQGPTYSWKPDFPIRNRCQFSWYCDGKSDVPTDSETWMESIILAFRIINFDDMDITEGSLWYHANYIDKPYWSDELTPTVVINNHIFYK